MNGDSTVCSSDELAAYLLFSLPVEKWVSQENLETYVIRTFWSTRKFYMKSILYIRPAYLLQVLVTKSDVQQQLMSGILNSAELTDRLNKLHIGGWFSNTLFSEINFQLIRLHLQGYLSWDLIASDHFTRNSEIVCGHDFRGDCGLYRRNL